MKPFLCRVVVFLCLAALTAYPLDLLFSKRLAQMPHGEFSVWSDIYAGKIDAEIAIYGSSRAWVHVSPKILQEHLGKKTYNFGMDGHNFWLQYLRHLEFFKHNPQPQIIIQTLDVTHTLTKREELYNEAQFLPYMLWNSDIYQFTRSYEGYSAWDYKIPFFRYFQRGNIFYRTAKDWRIRDRGYLGMNWKWNLDLERAQSEQDSLTMELDPGTLELFDRFLIECQSKGVQVILVYTPEYIGGQKFVKNRDEIISLFEHYAKKHNLFFLDYSSDPICFDTQYFYNALHLNRTGAELFSEKLATDLKKLIGRQPEWELADKNVF